LRAGADNEKALRRQVIGEELAVGGGIDNQEIAKYHALVQESSSCCQALSSSFSLITSAKSFLSSRKQ